MGISSRPQVRFGFLWGLFLVTGCGGASFQNLSSLTITATPSKLSTGGVAVLKAVTHLSDGTNVDVTSGTQWTLSNASFSNREQRSTHREGSGNIDRAGCLCRCGQHERLRKPECIDPDQYHLCLSSGCNQGSSDHVECASDNFIRHHLEQCAIERHRERTWNVHLLASGRHFAQSWNADAFRHLHAGRHKYVFRDKGYGAADRESGNSADRLGYRPLRQEGLS
jgi:hypothetical protein